jgi:hypothetical protein
VRGEEGEMGVFLFDAATWAVLDACSVAPGEFGYSRGEFLGLNLHNLIQLDSALEVKLKLPSSFGSLTGITAGGIYHQRFYRSLRFEERGVVVLDCFTLESQGKLFESWLGETPGVAEMVSEIMRLADEIVASRDRNFPESQLQRPSPVQI